MANERPTLGDSLAVFGWLVLIMVAIVSLAMARRALPSWISRRAQEHSYSIRFLVGSACFVAVATLLWIFLFMHHDSEWMTDGRGHTTLIIGASFMSFYGAFSLILTALEPTSSYSLL